MSDTEPPGPKSDKMAYRDQKRIAHDGSSEERRELAGRGDVRPEILYYLASDPDTEVRRNIARNPHAPRHADLLLAKDENSEVRVDVAGKIAEITAAIAGGKQDNVYRMTMEALEILACDQLLRVRQILAETLRDCPHVPVGVMERLALDRQISVSEPVLEHSPALTNEFLLRVITSGPVKEALGAIARRVALGENVADAIVQNGDTEAIAALLGNKSAQIREETLDRIVDQASGQPTWHKPLVHRPDLHAAAALRIAEIVAMPLLDELRKRTDLDERAISAIKQVVLRRLETEEFAPSAGTLDGDGPAAAASAHVEGNVLGDVLGDAPQTAGGSRTAQRGAKESVVAKRVREMYLEGKLGEHEISSAIASGGKEFVVYALSLKSKTALDVVSRAISMRSAKAIVAICWKAELSMRLAIRVQMHLANIPPGDVLRGTSTGDFPLSEDEMRWQLEFISGLATPR